MGSILQDMMGMASRKDTVTPKADDLLTLARYPNPQEKLKPRPSLRTELVTMAKLKTFINEGDGGGLVKSLTTTGTSGVSTLVSGVLNVPSYANSIEYVNSAAFDGATDLLTLNRVSGDSIQIDMNRKDVSEFVDFANFVVAVGEVKSLPVSTPGQLVAVTITGATGNATMNLPDASSNSGTGWNGRKITIVAGSVISATKTLTVAATNGTINGQANLVLNKLYASITIWSTGVNWIILSSSQVADI
jgi:hypothetical protein